MFFLFRRYYFLSFSLCYFAQPFKSNGENPYKICIWQKHWRLENIKPKLGIQWSHLCYLTYEARIHGLLYIRIQLLYSFKMNKNAQYCKQKEEKHTKIENPTGKWKKIEMDEEKTEKRSRTYNNDVKQQRQRKKRETRSNQETNKVKMEMKIR